MKGYGNQFGYYPVEKNCEERKDHVENKNFYYHQDQFQLQNLYDHYRNQSLTNFFNENVFYGQKQQQFPQNDQKFETYSQKNQQQKIQNSQNFYQIYQMCKSEYFKRKIQNQIWQIQMKKILNNLKLQIKIMQKIQNKKIKKINSQKVDVCIQFPEPKEMFSQNQNFQFHQYSYQYQIENSNDYRILNKKTYGLQNYPTFVPLLQSFQEPNLEKIQQIVPERKIMRNNPRKTIQQSKQKNAKMILKQKKSKKIQLRQGISNKDIVEEQYSQCQQKMDSKISIISCQLSSVQSEKNSFTQISMDFKSFKKPKKDKIIENLQIYSTQQVIENIKILRNSKMVIEHDQSIKKIEDLQNLSQRTQKYKILFNLTKKQLKSKPSYQTIRILAQIYIKYGYDYKMMQKIKYLNKDIKKLQQKQRQQYFRFKSIQNIKIRDYSNFTILIVRFTLRQLENWLIQCYGIDNIIRVKYYQFNFIRTFLLKFKHYFSQKFHKVWFLTVKILFELDENLKIPKEKDLIDIYIDIMKKVKSQIQLRAKNSQKVRLNKKSLNANFISPIFYDGNQQKEISDQNGIKCQNMELKHFSMDSQKQNQSLRQINFKGRSKHDFDIDSSEQLEEIYQFKV